MSRQPNDALQPQPGETAAVEAVGRRVTVLFPGFEPLEDRGLLTRLLTANGEWIRNPDAAECGHKPEGS